MIVMAMMGQRGHSSSDCMRVDGSVNQISFHVLGVAWFWKAGTHNGKHSRNSEGRTLEARPSRIALHPRFGGKMRSTKRRNLMRLFCRVFLIVLLFTVAARAADNKQPVISEHTFTVQLPATADQSEDRSSRDLSPKIVMPPQKIPSDQIELLFPPTCLTMRSMSFSRSGSDTVRYQKTTTCTPSKQFQVERAVMPVTGP